jgi:hypothetical protein
MIGRTTIDLPAELIGTDERRARVRKPNPIDYGLRGALLGSVGFAALFPAVLRARTRASKADLLVYGACGVMFGVITGGTIGAVVGGGGR